ncbi:MAG: class I SAM-dependent methyltransferase [Daejeonella sp.]
MLNLQLVSNYLYHIFKAKTRHGIHSPFVYRLIDEVIYDFEKKEDYIPIENLRNELLQDERFITITDLGAGSHINNNKEKQIKSLAKNALKPARLAQLIFRLVKRFSSENILELGTCLGITTAYLAKAAAQSRLMSIEGCPQTAAVAQENLNKLNIQNAELLVGNFDEILPAVIAKNEELDFVFIDGNHREQATLNYFNWCLPKLSKNGVMIFDDIYWSRGMKRAWKQIKDHPQVTVTIDLFWIGLVFIRSEQTKEHFKIRF